MDCADEASVFLSVIAEDQSSWVGNPILQVNTAAETELHLTSLIWLYR